MDITIQTVEKMDITKSIEGAKELLFYLEALPPGKPEMLIECGLDVFTKIPNEIVMKLIPVFTEEVKKLIEEAEKEFEEL